MERALGLWRELDMLPEVAMVLNGLSVVAYGRGDAALATRHAEESLAMTRAMGHAFGSAIALPVWPGWHATGAMTAAAAAFLESLQLWASIGDRETSYSRSPDWENLLAFTARRRRRPPLLGRSTPSPMRQVTSFSSDAAIRR